MQPAITTLGKNKNSVLHFFCPLPQMASCSQAFQSNFQLSVKSNPGLHWFCFTILCGWSIKLAPPSQPIRCKTKTNRDLVTRVSSRLHVFTLSSHWLLLIFIFVLIGRCDNFGFGFTTLNRKALYNQTRGGICLNLPVLICNCFPFI